MSFSLPDHWVWDFWFADDGDTWHLFYLHAPMSLGDPDLRHRNAAIGHAVSRDLTEWTDLGPCILPSGGDAVDATATWTGSVVRRPEGGWRMFYTGSRFLSDTAITNVETIIAADSDDLATWRRVNGLAFSAAGPYYETLADGTWREEAWRDPWVFARPEGGFGMLVTARSATGAVAEAAGSADSAGEDTDDRGVVGLALSPDLHTWTRAVPLSEPGAGFGHVEVMQYVELQGTTHLLFSCDRAALAGARRASGEPGGVWTVPVTAPGARVDLGDAQLLVDERLYAGRAVQDRAGTWQLLAFENMTEGGGFAGRLSDPLPLTVRDGHLSLADRAEEAA